MIAEDIMFKTMLNCCNFDRLSIRYIFFRADKLTHFNGLQSNNLYYSDKIYMTTTCTMMNVINDDSACGLVSLALVCGDGNHCCLSVKPQSNFNL